MAVELGFGAMTGFVHQVVAVLFGTSSKCP